MSGSDIPLESSGNCFLSAKGKGMYLSQQLTRGRRASILCNINNESRYFNDDE